MIVLDTNILVAALWSRKGASFKLLIAALRQEIDVAVSVALALEYEDVLKRETMLQRSWATAVEVDEILDALFHVAKRTAPISYRQRPMLRDADDDMVLECAIQAGASAIVTMNVRDFATVTKGFGISIIQPGPFLSNHLRS